MFVCCFPSIVLFSTGRQVVFPDADLSFKTNSVVSLLQFFIKFGTDDELRECFFGTVEEFRQEIHTGCSRELKKIKAQ